MPTKIKYYFKLTVAYLRKFKGLIAAGVFLGFMLFFAVSKVTPYFTKSTEKIGVVGRYTSDQLPDFILTKIGSGLTKMSKEGTALPSIAKDWVAEEQGKTWVFYLNENASWQDGKKVTSDEINYNFSDVAIERPDKNTIKFKLNDIFVPFPSIVSRPIFKKGLLGTGAWKVENIKISGNFISQLTLESNENERIIYKFYPTTKHAVIAFKLGQVDELIDLLDKSEFKSWPNILIEPLPKTNQIITIFFNNDDEFLSEKSLRQALTYAINKESLGGVRAKSPIPSDNWSYNSQVKEYAYDTEHAKGLLNEMDKDRRVNLKVKLTTSPDLLYLAEKISQDWKAVGVDSGVQVSPEIPSDYQAFLTILDVPVDPDQYTLWHSTQIDSNIARYKSPRVDQLLERGRTELNSEVRRQTYVDFQRFLLEDLPAAFLIYPNYYTITRR